eukprot:1130623_1
MYKRSYIRFIKAYCIFFVIISCIICRVQFYGVGILVQNESYVMIRDDKFVWTEYDISRRNQRNHNWYRYRLGDMVQWTAHAHNEEWGYQYHKRQFPDSIATQYLSYSNATSFKNYTLLLQIVRNRTINSSSTALINSINYNDTLIIHLRTGDIIDYRNPSVDDIMHSGSTGKYCKGRSYYIGVMNQFNHTLHKALFLTGWHQGPGRNHSKSILYITQIIKLFTSHGYQTSLRINENPDDDFLIMCNSKYFVQSGGGFSQVISKVVKLNGG